MNLLTPAELAAALRTSERTVARMVVNGCPSLMVGSRRRFDLEAVKAWAAVQPALVQRPAPAAIRSAADAFTAAYKRMKCRAVPTR